MKKSTVAIISFFVLGSVFLFWISGDLMRETDQACLLDGALQFSKSRESAQFFHNYSGQFGSYWLLSICQRLFKIQTLSEYVRWGNYFALGSFLLGLGVYLNGYVRTFTRQKGFAGRNVAIIISLTTPAVLLSLPLLSSNVLAGGAIIMLMGTHRLWSSGRKSGVFLGIVLLACALMLRKDAAFLLPLICFMPMQRLQLKPLFKRSYFWAFLVTSVVVMLIGSLVASISYFPAYVTDWRLIGCYGFFGLMGGGVALLWSIAQVWNRADHPVTRVVGCGAVLLPVLMYLPFMYSPRHLFMASLVPLVLASSQWVSYQRLGLLIVAQGVNVLWLTVAPVIHGEKRVSFGWRAATCYPTADGLWPIGGGAHFLTRLKQASLPGRAIDHNQELWAALSSLEPKENMSHYFFHSASPQRAYLYLWSTFYGGHSQYIRGDTPDLKLAYPSQQIIQMTTDREISEDQSFPPLESLVSTKAGRLIYLTPPWTKGEVDSQVLKSRKELKGAHKGVDFLTTFAPPKHDGHIYVEKRGVVFKSSYPKILTQSF